MHNKDSEKIYVKNIDWLIERETEITVGDLDNRNTVNIRKGR